MTRPMKAPSAGSAPALGHRYGIRPQLALGLAIAFVLSLALAPSAMASKGVVGIIENSFSTPRGVVVNDTGAGGVAPGTVYIVEGGARRVQVFSPTNTFLRSWGADVVSSGAGQANAVQSVAVAATGGTFTLTFGGQTTGATGTGNTTEGSNEVTGLTTSTGTFTVGEAISGPGIPAGTTITAVGPGTLTLSNNATANGAAVALTANLPWDATGLAVQNALGALSSIGAGNVAVTGGPGNATGSTPYRVEFTGTQGGKSQALITASNAGLIGTKTITIATTRVGATGFEICVPANGATCKAGILPPAPIGIGGFNEPVGLGIDQATGEVYVSERNQLRVHKFSALGDPLLTFGKDVNKTQSGTLFESCPRIGSPGDECQAPATTGALGGEFATTETARLTLAVVPPGPSNAGNVVVTDPGNRRIQEFTGAGGFARAFGYDVIANGQPGNEAQNEVHRVTVSATSGKFKLTFGGQTTGELPFDVPASGGVGPLASVQNALEALSSIGAGNVAVTGGPGDATGSAPYNVEFVGAKKDQELESLIANGGGLGAGTGKTLTCTGPVEATQSLSGAVDRTLASLTYQWLRNGAPIPGATSQTYQVTAADEGAAIQCQTAASATANGAGATQASTPVTNVSPLPATPRPVPPAALPVPTIIIELEQSLSLGDEGGARLNCATGTWTGGAVEEFTYQWYRNGVALVGNGAKTNQYTVQTVDLATPAHFQCAVTAKNSSGAVTRVTPHGPGLTGPHTRPQPDPRVEPVASVSDLAVSTTLTEGAKFEVCTTLAACKIGAPYLFDIFTGPAGRFPNGQPTRIAADSTGAVYALVLGRVQKFTPQAGPPALAPSIFGSDGVPNESANPQTETGGPHDLTIGSSGRIAVLKEYNAGLTPECQNGSSSPNERRVQEITGDGSTLVDVHGECAGIAASSNTGGVGISQVTGNVYISASSGGSRVFVLNETTAPIVNLDVLTPAKTSVKLEGAINPNPAPGYPNPPSTDWKVQYRLHGAVAWQSFGEQSVGAGSSDVPFQITIPNLLSAAEYDFRIAATKKFNGGQGFSPITTVSTKPAAPAIHGASTSKVTETSARLHAKIDPQGTATSYRFEYGATPNYGNSTPEVAIGDGQGPVAVFADIEGLEDVTYHFRVVATSDAGVSASENQTFDFHPPSCPNEALRQQTQANYLPDCRGYELTTPEYTGNSLVWAFRGPTASEATNPSRFAFNAVFGSISGTGGSPPNTGGDLYVATRTDEGWKSKYIGLPGSETFINASPFASATLDRVLLLSYPGAIKKSPAYVWDTSDAEKLVARWPTNLAEVANGENFTGSSVVSKDFSNFVFSSDIPFVDGASPGAIYDNDTETGEIEVISKTDTGSDFNAGMPLFVSNDGSHVLMSAVKLVPGCGIITPCATPEPSYMRVDGVTYSVNKGHKSEFAGMTDDGSRVYFTTTAQATGEDSDTSLDLYMWSDDTDSLTLVSVGAGAGNQDNCDTLKSWVSKCNIKLVTSYVMAGTTNAYDVSAMKPFSKFGGIPGGKGGNGFDDSVVAGDRSDIYFLSPEQLDGLENGIPGAVNMYVFRDGAPRFVAVLSNDPACLTRFGPSPVSDETTCAETSIGRMQVTPDGRYAAFLSQSRLTPYDNEGQTMMYRYDAVEGKMICVSCRPDGSPPSTSKRHVTQGSMNGLFITDDGRVFFNSPEPIAPQDTNNAYDVYEYVDGRAQLISQGTGPAASVLCDSCGLTSFAQPGLIGVSADGRDVYFSTYDVLTPQDRNGGNIKVYDARTNGGFPFTPPPPGCAAADECHGPTSVAPSPVRSGTGALLGGSGNAAAAKRKAAKRAVAKRKRASQRKRKAQKRASRMSQKRRNASHGHG